MTRNAAGPDPAEIRAMFGSIARGYDRANTILSGGIHHRWRKALVRWSGVVEGEAVLDCATGTGDLAIAFARAAGSRGRVVGTDFSAPMLEPAPEKARQQGVAVTFEVADVTALPFESSSFDVASIAFGIRNVADRVQALREMARVVRPGGRVMVLEFGKPDNRVVAALFRFYSRSVLPLLGGVLTGNRAAYAYLERSAAEFPAGRDFVALMEQAGNFSTIEYRSLTGGIAYAYRAIVAGGSS